MGLPRRLPTEAVSEWMGKGFAKYIPNVGEPKRRFFRGKRWRVRRLDETRRTVPLTDSSTRSVSILTMEEWKIEEMGRAWDWNGGLGWERILQNRREKFRR
jgi:hypothetical protein